MRLLYYSPASYGGIADYAREQANALVDLGIDVTFLCTPEYPLGKGEKYRVLPELEKISPNQPLPHKMLKKAHFAAIILVNFFKLFRLIQAEEFRYVLLGSYVEYLAPFWSSWLQQLAQSGVVFGAVVHDPVRDFIVGPGWWHRWSIACGYSFLKDAFVHEEIELDTVRPMPKLRTTVIPYGTHHFPPANKSRTTVRTDFNLPIDANVMLAFGHIRDNKNLDLVIRAMAYFPDLYLLVVGKEQSSGQRPAVFYQALAQQCGVANRCRWKVEFVPDTEIANLFEAADITILTYSKTFRSASSALNAAAGYRKPCLASAGESSLRAVVQRYKLGIWVEPDDVDSIVNGIEKWLKNPPIPRWEQYFEENSWMLNARLVVNSLSNNL